MRTHTPGHAAGGGGGDGLDPVTERQKDRVGLVDGDEQAGGARLLVKPLHRPVPAALRLDGRLRDDVSLERIKRFGSGLGCSHEGYGG